jgi:diguanylate cyclase (GGDEF)-like protein
MLLRGRLDAAFALALPMSVMDAVGSALMVAIFCSAGTAWALTGWLSVSVAVSAARIAMALMYRSGRDRARPLIAWARGLVVLAALGGLLWGGALAWMLANGSGAQVLVVLCIALSATALSVAHIVFWPIYAAYAVPIVLGAAVGFAASDRPGAPLLAGGACLVALMLIPVSRRLAREVLRAHQLAADNQRLVDSLAERSRELEEACRTLEQVSRTDPLTGLANRRSRDLRLAAEWERALRLRSPLAVVVLDVDHFKRYNDAHGHAAGDRCLKAVATLLQSTTRGAVDLACRHGGEEFMLILPGLDRRALASLAERVRVRIARGTADPALDLPERVTVSLGAAVSIPVPEIAPHELLAAADAALYRAKLGGRNRYEMSDLLPFSRGDVAA